MKRLATAALVVAMIASAASAISLPVTGSNLIGDRFTSSTPSTTGLCGSGNWSSSGTGFEISWDISQITTGGLNGDWIYQYTVTEANGKTALPDCVSHLMLEVSSSITSCNIFDPCNCCVTGPGSYKSPNGVSLNAIQISPTSSTFSFDSNHSPMWGNFYALDNNCSTYVWNNGINTGSVTYPATGATVFTNWIPVPDTVVTGAAPIPEPATMTLLGLGIIGVLARRKSAKA